MMNSRRNRSASKNGDNQLQGQVLPSAIPSKALIYCRVSSKRQAIEGSGLDSQEHRCRQYAITNGYEVEAVFPDDVSGGGDFMNRSGMVALLAYLGAKPRENFVIIFDDLKRFSRDVEFHWKLRRELEAHGATIACLNMKLEDTPEGRFVESMMAATGQLEREQNKRQTSQKTRARIEKGYWAFNAPIGYHYEKVNPHGKLLVRNEPIASILQEALEGYASGRFASQAEVQRFFESQPDFPKCIKDKGLVRMERVTSILRNAIYAGYVEAAAWNISQRKGHHEGLISLAAHKKIQDRIDGATKVGAWRKDLSDDFPLRGFVSCADCGSSLTASWSKGRSKHYAYYHCHNRGCESFQKTIARTKLEGRVEDLLRRLQPTQGLFKVAAVMFAKAWDGQAANAAKAAKALKTDIARIESEAEKMLDRLVSADTPAVIAAYEKRIAKLDEEKALAVERVENCTPSRTRFREMFEPAMMVLSNPWKLWASGDLNLRRLVLRLAFEDRIPHCRKTGLRTAEISMPFKALAALKTSKCEMVLPERIELSTSPLPRECSTSELRQQWSGF